MPAPTAARIAALATLQAVRAGALASRAVEPATARLDARDRAWTRELVYGTLRLRGRLDFRLAALSSRPLASLDPDILDVLRLGAYQLLEMGGVPAYAAVSQSVDLARRAAGRGASGFVNGVLQSLRRAGPTSTFPDFGADPVGYLTTWGSHPRWLVERWLQSYGPEGTRELIEANNRRPELYLRALGDVAAAHERLAECGVGVEPVLSAPRALRVVSGELDAALEAPVIVQDPAAGLVVSYADVPAGGTVIDLAAAPGGKALGMASDRSPSGVQAGPGGGDGGAAPGSGAPRLVVAADVSHERLERVRQNVARLRRPAPAGLGDVPLAMVVADGRRPPFRGSDAVLLDAPCTGTGTLRRHPDGRWRLQPADVRKLAELQARLLDAAADLVPRGGLLVYSTCSLEPEENELQVGAFLERHTGFDIEAGGAIRAPFLQPDGTLSVLPQRDGWDGAYAARMRRRN